MVAIFREDIRKPLNSTISKFPFSAIDDTKSKIPSSKNKSSWSKGNIYFPLDLSAPIHLEYKVPIFFLLLINKILGSSSWIFVITSQVLVLEASLTKIISKFVISKYIQK